jgi:coenzyme F420 hydrogenase subunit beta
MRKVSAAPPNVSGVRDAGLCMGCGTCESVCSARAIQVKRHDRQGLYLPVIDSELCVECGLCAKVCPGASVDIEQLADEFLDGSTREKMLGAFHACYVGHASEHDIRYNSASGGLATSLLIYALEKKVIDGALVLGMSESNPFETKPFIATKPSEIISASGSKYCPSAINTELHRILSEGGRFAIVGLPCHIHAVRKLETFKRELRENIVLHLGLFCGNSSTYLGTEFFLRQNRMHPEDVREIRYRGEGWPGKIRVTLHDDTRRTFPLAVTEKRWYRRALFWSAFHHDFSIPRCLLCPDLTCELADIALGDPVLDEYIRSERIGKSLIIVRNRTGGEFLTEAMEAGVVVLEDISLDRVRKAQNYAFKAGVGGRIRLRRVFGFAVPGYGGRDLSFTPRDILKAFRYLPSYFSCYRWLWPLLRFSATVHYGWREITAKFNLLLDGKA